MGNNLVQQLSRDSDGVGLLASVVVLFFMTFSPKNKKARASVYTDMRANQSQPLSGNRDPGF
jgi:hypothetical protein